VNKRRRKKAEQVMWRELRALAARYAEGMALAPDGRAFRAALKRRPVVGWEIGGLSQAINPSWIGA
jgi:hypothetical protein